MTSVHGISVAGGTFPGADLGFVHDGREGGHCDSFRPSVDQPECTPFYGQYASTGTSADTELQTQRQLLHRAVKGPRTTRPAARNYRSTTRASTTRRRRRRRRRRPRRRRTDGAARRRRATAMAGHRAGERKGTASDRAALAALIGLSSYAGLAVLPAADGSNLVLATAGGSPDWLLGPLRVVGADWTDGWLGGPLFYAGSGSRSLSGRRWSPARPRHSLRAVIAAVVAVARALPAGAAAPVAGRLLLHRLRAARSRARPEPVRARAGRRCRRRRLSVRGLEDGDVGIRPALHPGDYPLAGLGVPTAFWILKVARGGGVARAGVGRVANRPSGSAATRWPPRSSSA